MTFSDITERKLAEDEIKQLAFYDSLTELPNRRLMVDRLQQALAPRFRHQREGALLLTSTVSIRLTIRAAMTQVTCCCSRLPNAFRLASV